MEAAARTKQRLSLRGCCGAVLAERFHGSGASDPQNSVIPDGYSDSHRGGACEAAFTEASRERDVVATPGGVRRLTFQRFIGQPEHCEGVAGRRWRWRTT